MAETLASDWEVTAVVATPSFVESHSDALRPIENRVMIADKEALAQVSTYETNDAALAIVRIKPVLKQPDADARLWLAVDQIRDPGNLGTIIRLADWFGLSQIICLGDVVEWYNPKVIRSSMGSFLRVFPVYIENQDIMDLLDRPLLVADMEGKSVFSFEFPAKCTLIIGNEANGASTDFEATALKITIPRFGKAESLNAGIATGIMLSHWKQRQR